jgi:hypothetical protein
MTGSYGIGSGGVTRTVTAGGAGTSSWAWKSVAW